MLVVFHLGWDRFNIDEKVSAATRKVNGIAKDKQAGNFMIFNLASLGAGEIIIDRKERLENARKSDPDFDAKLAEKGVVDKDVNYQRPHTRTVDYIRRRHHRIARDLGHDEQFKAYRDATEMLTALRSRGHQLAAVFTGVSKEAQQGLKLARALDYFEDHVYGSDSLQSRREGTITLGGLLGTKLIPDLELRASTEAMLTSSNLYRHAMKMQKTAPIDSIIVADTPEAVEAGVTLKPMAVAGYLDPYLENKEIDRRLAEMRSAGAQYAVVGGHGISSLPDYLHGTRRLQSQRDLMMKKLGFDLK